MAHAAGGTLVLKGPAAPMSALTGVLGEDETRTVDIPSSQTGWVRAEVRGPDGALWLFGNPVYLTGP